MRPIVALFLISLVGEAASQSCKNPYVDFLKCVFGTALTQSAPLEQEYFQSIKDAARKCFSPDVKDAINQNKCLFMEEEFKSDGFTAFAGDCYICQQLGNFMRDVVLVGKAEDRTCVNRHLFGTIKGETLPCMKAQLGADFDDKADFPEFDELARTNRDIVEASAKLFMSVANRLDFCRSKSKERAKTSQACWEDIKAMSRPKHCQIVTKCSGASSTCDPAKATKTFKVMCDCMMRKRTEVLGRIKAAAYEVLNLVKTGVTPTTKQQCMDIIHNAMLSQDTKVDWLEGTEYVINHCLSVPPPLPVKTLIEGGCQWATENNYTPLMTVVHLIANFIDSLLSRFGRFCTCA